MFIIFKEYSRHNGAVILLQNVIMMTAQLPTEEEKKKLLLTLKMMKIFVARLRWIMNKNKNKK